MFYKGSSVMKLPEGSLEHMEVMAAEDPLQLYVDLDFYAWLAEEGEND